jgi:hypothetical protein
MTLPKAKQPLESFDPRMMELLIRGARRRIVIPFPGAEGKRLAHQFQRRMHTLRARMRQSNHEHTATVSRCIVRILWGDRALRDGIKPAPEFVERFLLDTGGALGAWIVIQPTDAVFDSVLSKLDFLSSPDAPPLEGETATEEEDLTSYVESLKPKE